MSISVHSWRVEEMAGSAPPPPQAATQPLSAQAKLAMNNDLAFIVTSPPVPPGHIAGALIVRKSNFLSRIARQFNPVLGGESRKPTIFEAGRTLSAVAPERAQR